MNPPESRNETLSTAVNQYRCERWQEENREGIEAMNVFVERNGSFTDDENFQVL
ncbi:type II toxin-antitoxin system CcdA family antitoxin [Leminorella grimontii]|uniref:type II toxin-antitoxin system CcdA family antitoxin n=1 Tax=Leminorella grimontii TaxID=82981 RepID=UPI0020840E70|nr:type II toxin-antitoxin system CcdA family antitoxin [Leminorella grimontii]GKX59417.1 hypothetical protein SOASR031_17320 [Leminorella grimontii]